MTVIRNILEAIKTFSKNWREKPCIMCNGTGRLNVSCERSGVPDNCPECIFSQCVYCDGLGKIKYSIYIPWINCLGSYFCL